MKTQNKPDDIAAKRMMLIMPLLEDGMDHQRIIELKKQIAATHDISYRTITRYLDSYLKDGFDGLRPVTGFSRTQDLLPMNFSEIVDNAIELRRECPTRSVNDLIKIMELENLIEKGSVSRSTLQRHLANRGFGSAQMKVYTKKGVASRRFQKSHRGMLYQGDIKYGPYLPIGR